jgi:hypothetical protein
VGRTKPASDPLDLMREGCSAEAICMSCVDQTGWSGSCVASRSLVAGILDRDVHKTEMKRQVDGRLR